MENKNQNSRREIRGSDLMFSVYYDSPYEDDDDYTIDWGRKPSCWTTSCKEYGLGHGWEFSDDFTQVAYKGLLKAFGIPEDKFTLEETRTMSPRELVMNGGHNIRSRTLGDERVASNVGEFD